MIAWRFIPSLRVAEEAARGTQPVSAIDHFGATAAHSVANFCVVCSGRGGAAYLRLKRIKEKLKERSARPKRSDRGGGDQEDQEAEVARRQATLRNIEDGGVADYDDLPPLHINLKRTIGDLERWPGLIKDYSALTSYFLFCVVFMGLVVFQVNSRATPTSACHRLPCARSFVWTLLAGILTHITDMAVVVQLDVPTQYEIDHMVRHRLLDQEGALAAITNHGDVFNYLLKDFDGDLGEFTDEDGGVFGTLFEAEYYNGDPIIGEDVGFLFSFNKLIGGLCTSISARDSKTRIKFRRRAGRTCGLTERYGNGLKASF